MVQIKPLLARAGDTECIEYKITYPAHLKLKIAKSRLLEAYSPVYDERTFSQVKTLKVTLAEVEGRPAILVSFSGKPEEWNWVNAKVLFRKEAIVHLLIESWTLQKKLYELLTGEELRYLDPSEARRLGKQEILTWPIETMVYKEDDIRALIVMPVTEQAKRRSKRTAKASK